MKEFIADQSVSLQEMLDAREFRAAKQQMLINQMKVPLVCFTLNIPGEYKVFPLSVRCFKEGKEAIELLLREENLAITNYEENNQKTGYEAYFSIDADADSIKKLLLPLEENHRLGRLFDIDVISTEGALLKGVDFGRNERECIICKKPVWVCARSRAHSSDELFSQVINILKTYFTEQMADSVAQEAVNALITEVCISPKPGLVDRLDNGAHRDMDVFTFIKSGCALFSYFREVFLLSANYVGAEDCLLEAMRFRGIIAEDTMFKKTDGVNTHKGAIFSLGLICASLGYLYAQDEDLTYKHVLEHCSILMQKKWHEFETTQADLTNGEKAYYQYGISGIRGEAEAGFASVSEYALPVLKKYLSKGYTVEQAGVVALLHLIAHVEDTNIISRSNINKFRAIQEDVRIALKNEEYAHLLEYANNLNHYFITVGVSPGGCADLLAVTVFINSVFCTNGNFKVVDKQGLPIVK